MASAVDRLLEDLLSSDEEEEAGAQSNDIAQAAAPAQYFVSGNRCADGEGPPLQSSAPPPPLGVCVDLGIAAPQPAPFGVHLTASQPLAVAHCSQVVWRPQRLPRRLRMQRSARHTQSSAVCRCP